MRIISYAKLTRVRGSSFLMALVLFLHPSLTNAAKLIPADDANIQYSGRFDFTDPKKPTFSWPAVSIRTVFTGTSISVELVDAGRDYSVIIDGVDYPNVSAMSGISTYTLASGLADGEHDLLFARRDGFNRKGNATFGGFTIEDDAELLLPPAKPTRKIEFLGDSYLCGQGAESTGRTCSPDAVRSLTNANIGFGVLTAQMLNAEPMVLGWAGKGVVRNYNEPNAESTNPFPTVYDKTVGTDVVWDFTSWIPDVVVITLGTNDFNSPVKTDQATFKTAYHAFIDRIATTYAQADILCVSAVRSPLPTLIKDIVDEEKSGANGSRVFFADFPEIDQLGCNYHPSSADHKLIASMLADSISSITGWDVTGTAPIAATIPSGHHTEDGLIADIKYVDTGLQMTFERPSESVEIFDVSGALVGRLGATAKNQLTWNTSGISAGMYLVKAVATGSHAKDAQVIVVPGK